MEKLKYDGNEIVSWDKCDWRPQETKKPKLGALKLSEAIRVGAQLRPQCSAYPFNAGKSCAIGAAYEANFGHPGSGQWQMSSLHEGKMILSRLAEHYGFSFYSVASEIWNRNDDGQSREEIADWLESLGH